MLSARTRERIEPTQNQGGDARFPGTGRRLRDGQRTRQSSQYLRPEERPLNFDGMTIELGVIYVDGDFKIDLNHQRNPVNCDALYVSKSVDFIPGMDGGKFTGRKGWCKQWHNKAPGSYYEETGGSSAWKYFVVGGSPQDRWEAEEKVGKPTDDFWDRHPAHVDDNGKIVKGKGADGRTGPQQRGWYNPNRYIKGKDITD